MKHSFEVELVNEVGLIPSIIYTSIKYWCINSNIKTRQGHPCAKIPKHRIASHHFYLNSSEISNAMVQLIDNYFVCEMSTDDWYYVKDVNIKYDIDE